MVGDSGAGKSETLEALRNILDERISEMVTIFDDMGAIDKNLLAYGTETGAFVRMDDLDVGYAYKELDRAILMNPDKKNARTIVPISSLNNIIKGEKIDIILYANNYENLEGIKIFTHPKEAIKAFKEGKRQAKLTTSEEGLVTSYFANPFGPTQLKEQTDTLIDKYFDMYGYNVHTVGTPNRAVRRCYTYVKTAGCNVHGNIPADDCRVIESIFDNGIRFWKNHNQIGNYNVNNSPA
jgi:hypothetical protein